MLAGEEGAPGTPFTSGGTVAQPIEKADATRIAIGLLDIMRGIDSGTSERPAMLHESVAFNRLVERCSLSERRGAPIPPVAIETRRLGISWRRSVSDTTLSRPRRRLL